MKKKGMRRLRLIVAATAAAMLITTAGAFACTGMYVGKDASKEGTTTIARSEDQGGGAYNKMFKVQKRVTKAGRYYKDTANGLKVALPKTTYKYTYVPDSSDANDGQYPASCTNEYGLAVIGTVSTGVSEEYEKLDPTKDNALREAILPGLVACQSKTALQAVEVTGKLITKYGSEEWNTLLYADQKEAWIIETYGGSTWCAYKLPADSVAVFGNQVMIQSWDPADKENFRASDNLQETLDKVGAVKNEDGTYNVAKTVTGSTRDEYSNMRTWEGHRILAPSTEGISTYNNDEFYPLAYKPDQKVSVTDLMDLYRDRYEGTDYDMSKAENASRRCIGVTRSSDIHITQVYSNLPKDSCDLQWLCMGNAEHSVFIPAFSGITDTLAAYKVDGSAYNAKSAWWQFKSIDTVAGYDREFLSQGVKDFWKAQETSQYASIQKKLKMVSSKYKKSKKTGRAYVTSLGKTMAQKQLNNVKVLYAPLEYVATNNHNDRANNKRKTTFVKPVALINAAKAAGYKVKVSGRNITLTKDGVKWGLTNNSKGYFMDGEYEDDLDYPIYTVNKVVYAPSNFADNLTKSE